MYVETGDIVCRWACKLAAAASRFDVHWGLRFCAFRSSWICGVGLSVMVCDATNAWSDTAHPFEIRHTPLIQEAERSQRWGPPGHDAIPRWRASMRAPQRRRRCRFDCRSIHREPAAVCILVARISTGFHTANLRWIVCFRMQNPDACPRPCPRNIAQGDW